MFAVIREANDPPSRELLTINRTLSGLVGPATGNPTYNVDCGAPGRSVTSRIFCVFGAAAFSSAVDPFAQPEKFSAIAFFTAAPSNFPATYKCARAAP